MLDLRKEVEAIWLHDEELQTTALTNLFQEVRNVTDADMLRRDIAFLKNMKAFFVPDDEYLKEILGHSITSPEYGIYNLGVFCSLAERLAIPLRVLTGEIIGFVGYSNTPTGYYGDDTEEQVVRKYTFPSKRIFTKSDYMFCEPVWFQNAMRDGYVCITDGLFDAIRLNSCGVNALSLCGSNLSPRHKLYLSFIQHKIVIGDNDLAGSKLNAVCRQELTNCISLSFSGTNDIDDYLKDPNREQHFLTEFGKMRNSGFSYCANLDPGLPRYVKVVKEDPLLLPESDTFKQNGKSQHVQVEGFKARMEMRRIAKLQHVFQETTSELVETPLGELATPLSTTSFCEHIRRVSNG